MESVYFGRLTLSHLFNGNASDVGHYAQKLKKESPMKSGSHIHVGYYQYLIAMADIHAYRLSGNKRTLRQVEKAIKLLEKYVSKGNLNVKDLQLLLVAELATFNNQDQVQERYDQAIAAARVNQHVHREAIASERAAIFFIDNGQLGIATEYMAQAKRFYQKWGASGKTAHIREKYAFLFYDSNTSKSSRSRTNQNSQNVLSPFRSWMGD
jgi:hypothetical protein